MNTTNQPERLELDQRRRSISIAQIDPILRTAIVLPQPPHAPLSTTNQQSSGRSVLRNSSTTGRFGYSEGGGGRSTTSKGPTGEEEEIDELASTDDDDDLDDDDEFRLPDGRDEEDDEDEEDEEDWLGWEEEEELSLEGNRSNKKTKKRITTNKGSTNRRDSIASQMLLSLSGRNGSNGMIVESSTSSNPTTSTTITTNNTPRRNQPNRSGLVPKQRRRLQAILKDTNNNSITSTGTTSTLTPSSLDSTNGRTTGTSSRGSIDSGVGEGQGPGGDNKRISLMSVLDGEIRGRSCEQCRSRKVKCSSHETCNTCRARGEICVWKTGAPLYVHGDVMLAQSTSLRREHDRLIRLTRILTRRCIDREKRIARYKGRETLPVPTLKDVPIEKVEKKNLTSMSKTMGKGMGMGKKERKVRKGKSRDEPIPEEAEEGGEGVRDEIYVGNGDEGRGRGGRRGGEEELFEDARTLLALSRHQTPSNFATSPQIGFQPTVTTTFGEGSSLQDIVVVPNDQSHQNLGLLNSIGTNVAQGLSNEGSTLAGNSSSSSSSNRQVPPPPPSHNLNSIPGGIFPFGTQNHQQPPRPSISYNSSNTTDSLPDPPVSTPVTTNKKTDSNVRRRPSTIDPSFVPIPPPSQQIPSQGRFNPSITTAPLGPLSPSATTNSPPPRPPTKVYYPILPSPLMTDLELERLRRMKMEDLYERNQGEVEEMRRKWHVARYENEMNRKKKKENENALGGGGEGKSRQKRKRIEEDRFVEASQYRRFGGDFIAKRSKAATVDGVDNDEDPEERERRNLARQAAETWSRLHAVNERIDQQKQRNSVPTIVAPVEPYRSVASTSSMMKRREDPMLGGGGGAFDIDENGGGILGGITSNRNIFEENDDATLREGGAGSRRFSTWLNSPLSTTFPLDATSTSSQRPNLTLVPPIGSCSSSSSSSIARQTSPSSAIDRLSKTTISMSPMRSNVVGGQPSAIEPLTSLSSFFPDRPHELTLDRNNSVSGTTIDDDNDDRFVPRLEREEHTMTVGAGGGGVTRDSQGGGGEGVLDWDPFEPMIESRTTFGWEIDNI